MKNSFTLILGVLIALTSWLTSANASNDNTIDQLIPKIMRQVVTCSVRPFSLNFEGVKTYHAILSHCDAVKVTAPGVAEIKVEGHFVRAALVESENSDGDLYHVNFLDVTTGETKTLKNVAAYGDVLLGVLGGNASQVTDQFLPEGDILIKNGDANLLN
jgi:hypothetical protein